MADCVTPVPVNMPQVITVADTVIESETLAAGFSLDDIPVAKTDDLENVPIEGEGTANESTDPLLAMIELLSGITGAVRSTTPAGAAVTQSAYPQSGINVDPAETDSSAGLQTGTSEIKASEIDTRKPAPQPDGTRIETLKFDNPKIDASKISENAPAWTADPASVIRDVTDPKIDPSTIIIDSAVVSPEIPVTLQPLPYRISLTEPRVLRAQIVPIARQLAEAVVTTRDELVEIALSPEELGRIKMVISGPEHHPHVVVWAERPEVMEQLRRNATILQECFCDAGLSDASFEFGGDGGHGTNDDRGASDMAQRSAGDLPQQAHTASIAWTPMVIPARLDIRI